MIDPADAIGGERQRDARRSAPTGKRRSVIISSDIERDRETVTEFVMCCHCGRHLIYRKGSGGKLGRCEKCNDVTCGPTCPAGQGCVPHEQFIENIEAGRAMSYERPVMVSAGGIILGR